MGIYTLKPWFQSRLKGLEDALVSHRVSPDRLSLLAVLVSVLAGTALALGGYLERPLLWLTVPPLCVTRLALNALDGQIARRSGKARPFGTALNEMTDRMSDAAILAGASTVVPGPLVASTVALAFLTSLTGVLGFEVVGRRLTGGPMGKADRVAVLSGAVLVAQFAGSFWLIVGVSIIAVGCVATIVLRVTELHRKGAEIHAAR